ncbi:aspartyl protease family protein [Marivirga salinae]|uniref:Aspartyl protease family protein n=1 Tax=Marivirga salinarum TaxID=3059078 RepID=A0AA51NCX3_9BACT|nr:aspartyl protease family protein [Marivirga sp. BDSF4-3]WMN12853.1 aspartyl protease family protein [Marivirga sp. BDSF4-3]
MIKKCIYYAFLTLLILTAEIKKVSGQNLKFGFEINDDKKSTSIPFDINSNLIIVDVLFEGVIPLKFIVDTGVTNTVLIDKTYSDILNIEPDRKLVLIGAAGIKEVEAYIANKTNIKVGKITGNNIPLLILKEDYLNLQKNLGIKIHGILGYDFFKNFIVKVDYRNEVMKFYLPESFNRPMFFYRSIEMKIEQSKPYIYQKIKLNDSTEILSKLMIDTGASHPLMLHKNSSKDIQLPEKNVRDVLGAGIAGSIEGHAARIPQLSLDKYILEDVVANYPDSGAYEDIIKITGRNGTIGGGVLKHFKLFFDYGNDKLYIRRNSLKTAKFKHDMSGMTVVAKGEYYLEPYYEIEKVRENTPAYDAGLRKEDKIISLNGNSGKGLSLELINRKLRKKEGKKIKIKVKRGEKILAFTFYLEAFI